MHHHAAGISIHHNLDHDYNDDDDNDDDNGDEGYDDVEHLSVEAGASSNRGGVRRASGDCRCEGEDHHDTGGALVIIIVM